jgi:hypothetical protein
VLTMFVVEARSELSDHDRDWRTRWWVWRHARRADRAAPGADRAHERPPPVVGESR